MSPVVALPVFGAALVVTLLSARLFARRLDALGLRFGLPEAVIGLLTALAADGPEISSALFALAKGAHAVSVGVIVDSNAFNLAAMIGISGLLTGTVVLARETLVFEGVTGAAILLIATGVLLHAIDPLAATVLCAAVLIPYVVVIVGGAEPLLRRRRGTPLARFLRRALAQRPRGPVASIEPSHATRRLLLMGALDIALIVGGSAAMVQSVLDLGADWHVSQTVLATLVLAPLTSLPNAITAVRLGIARRGAALVSETFNRHDQSRCRRGCPRPVRHSCVAHRDGNPRPDLVGGDDRRVYHAAGCATRLRRPGAACLMLLYAGFVAFQLASA